MFNFFLKSNRKGILSFCGHIVNVEFDINESEGKNTFRKFDNGQYKNKTIVSRHPNIVKSVIIGKKSWGLWCDQWSEGISEGTFLKKDILDEFTKLGIIVPQPLMKDFDDRIHKKIIKRSDRIRLGDTKGLFF